nr:hypothetical protein [uncultured Clostridium sp.]
MQSWLKSGCNGFESSRPISQPLSFWMEQDILRYLQSTGLSYASIYGDIIETKNRKGSPILTTTGVARSGCMFCMYGIHLEPQPNRFQKMKLTHTKQYNYCIYVPGCGQVLDFISVPY